MIIEHKIVSNCLGKRVLTNKDSWIEPKNIVSIETGYLRLLDMRYTKITTADSQTYYVFDEACRKAILNYQNQTEKAGEDQKQEENSDFLGKHSENFLISGVVAIFFFTFSLAVIHSYTEIPQVQKFYDKILASDQP